MSDHKYWIVGAMWEGRHDMAQTFYKGGYWYLGYTRSEDPDQNKLRDQMQVHDRIAIKRMLGRGSPDIEIKAIGIIKHLDEEDEYRRAYVDWIETGLTRKLPSRGFFASVHGPLLRSDSWVQQAFCL